MKNLKMIIGAGIACLSLWIAPISAYATTYKYVTADSLNIRTSPEIADNVVKTVPYRTRVMVAAIDGDWAEVVCANGEIRWCSASYLSDKQPEVKAATSSKGNYIGSFQLTAYCNCSLCCGKWAGGPTASGTTPTEGRTVACNSIPMGTHIIINGHEYIVEDTGAMGNNVIDIYMASHSAGNQFGRKFNVPVYYAN